MKRAINSFRGLFLFEQRWPRYLWFSWPSRSTTVCIKLSFIKGLRGYMVLSGFLSPFCNSVINYPFLQEEHWLLYLRRFHGDSITFIRCVAVLKQDLYADSLSLNIASSHNVLVIIVNLTLLYFRLHYITYCLYSAVNENGVCWIICIYILQTLIICGHSLYQA